MCVWCEMGICMYVCEIEKAMLQERSVCVWCEMGICMYVCEIEKAMLQERSVCVWCEMGICMYVCDVCVYVCMCRCLWVQHKYHKLYTKYKTLKSAIGGTCPQATRRGSKSPGVSTYMWLHIMS